MRTRAYIFFDRQYFFEKQKLAEHIGKVLFGAKKRDALEKELFDLYRAGAFERFCGLPLIEEEQEQAINAIIGCLDINGTYSICVGDFCSVWGMHIIIKGNNLNIGQINSDNALPIFYVSPFCLEDPLAVNAMCEFIVDYTIIETVTQSVESKLLYVVNGNVIHRYASEMIDLSKKGEKTIKFEVPKKDIFTQTEGCYFLSFGSDDVASITFPRIGLPIKDGIYNFSELWDFCRTLTGSPTKDLFMFYELVKNRVLDTWLQDNEGESVYKNQISNFLNNRAETGQIIKINDINKILTIICNRSVTFPMAEYFSGIVRIEGEGVERHNVNNRHIYLLKGTANNTVTMSIVPKERCDIEFRLKVFIGGEPISDNETIINLSEIENKDEKSFAIDALNSPLCPVIIRDMTSECSLQTNSFIHLKRNILIPRTTINMVEICLTGDCIYYIAENVLSREQFSELLTVARSSRIDNIDELEARLTAQMYVQNNQPITFLRRYTCQIIRNILKLIFTGSNYEAVEPSLVTTDYQDIAKVKFERLGHSDDATILRECFGAFSLDGYDFPDGYRPVIKLRIT